MTPPTESEKRMWVPKRFPLLAWDGNKWVAYPFDTRGAIDALSRIRARNVQAGVSA